MVSPHISDTEKFKLEDPIVKKVLKKPKLPKLDRKHLEIHIHAYQYQSHMLLLQLTV